MWPPDARLVHELQASEGRMQGWRGAAGVGSSRSGGQAQGPQLARLLQAYLEMVRQEQAAAKRRQEKEEEAARRRREEQQRQGRLREAAFDGNLVEMHAVLQEVPAGCIGCIGCSAGAQRAAETLVPTGGG